MNAVGAVEVQVVPQRVEKPHIAQKPLIQAERQNLADRFQSFSRSRAPLHIAIGDRLLHLGPRRAKRPEHITEIRAEAQRVFIPQERAYLQVARVDMQRQEPTGEYTSSDVFTDFVLRNTNISEESKSILAEYTSNPDNALVMIRSEKPTKEFRQALRHHANEYNGGIALQTQADVLIDGLYHEFGSTAPDAEENTPERQSLHNLVVSANNGKSIHFAALTPDETGVVPEKVKSALKELNGAIDPYEFVYWTLSSLSESQRRSQVEALILLGIGAATPGMLDKVGAVAGPAGEMFVGSVTGDIISATLAGRGVEGETKHAEPLQKRRIHKMLAYIRSTGEKLRHDPSMRKRLIAGGALLGVTGAAIGLSVLTGGIVPFLIAQAGISTAIIAREVHKRQSMNPKSSEEVREILQAYMEKSHGFVRQLAEKYPRIHALSQFASQPSVKEHFANRFPKTTLAWYDVAKNPTAVGAWAGSVLSLPFLLFLTSVTPVPLSWSIAISSLILENGVGAVAGIGALRKDPWENFEEELPRVERMMQLAKGSSADMES